ncbi:MAG: NAD(P)(+) transhydrogenase (Re/Si-specific) subunit alpha, partial [Bosea sp. (in: a-proteobacteria)]
MRIAVLAETQGQETRVAATPETVKKFIALGAELVVEKGAGLTSGIADADYEAAGAAIAKTAKEALKGAAIVLKVRRPSEAEIKTLPS